MAWTLRVRARFSAAHNITIRGVPEGLHGHNYTVEVFLRIERLGPEGIGVDFREIRKALRGVLPDHKYLNEVMRDPPSAENIAKLIYDRLSPKFPNLIKVVVWETPDQAAEYEP